ncbi:MAG: Cys-tRNA(Pro) deacylase [Gammaproteobacteria bacterium]
MTPAIEILKRKKVAFVLHEYEHDPSSHSYGMEAAEKLGFDPSKVFKTLVVTDDKNNLYVGMVSVSKQLNLKKLAAALKVKKLSMADKNLVERVSGYVVGGVSPLGQKKRLPTVLDSDAVNQEKIYVSGGKRGLDIELAPHDLVALLGAKSAKISG